MIAVHPDGERVYAASANGGVWYTSDGGTSWRSLGGFAVTAAGEITRPAQRHTCGSIAVVFGATEAADVVYVGTGEYTHPRDTQPGHSLGGIGVLVGDHPATHADPDPWVREAKNLLGEGVIRIAVQPGGNRVVAATTKGLYERTNPGRDNDWTLVAGSPFSSLRTRCSDVLWTAAHGPIPERLWVWVEGGASSGLWVRQGTDTDFQAIATAGADADRSVLAAANPPDQIFLFNNRPNDPYLYRIDAAGAGLPTATRVTAGVPNVVQANGFWGIAAEVHPTNRNRVVLAGMTFNTTAPDATALNQDAGVVVGDVALAAGALTFGSPTMLGVGTHADIHDIAYSNNGDRVWLATDGGVFRSDHAASRVAFFPVNDGLSVIEANYIANHPTCEGHVVAGLQDNGVVERKSNGVWDHTGDGDAGGVAFDPIDPRRHIRQFTNGDWGASDFSLPALPLATNESSDKAAFYSTPAAIAHRRGVAANLPANVGQIIVGTSRVWFTQDFGTTWRTLPGGGTPAAGDLSTDDFGAQIRVCRWQSPDVAWVLSEGMLKRYSRTPGTDSGASVGTWAPPETVIRKGVKNKKDTTSADGPIRESAVWTDIAVNLDPPAAAGQPPTQRGTRGAIYLGTIGHPDNQNVDTLWWFDGTSTWHSTRLRTDPDGVPAPVTALACDPDHPDEVWVGTTVGVWQGVRTLHGSDPPTWAWHQRVNGLPEAAVEDLAIFSHAGLRLLRAGIASRGVWELRLDVTDVADLVYVRAHEDDLRYRPRAVGKQRDTVTDRSWHSSPDLRPRRAPFAPSRPATLPWTRAAHGADPEILRRFQAALRSSTRDLRVRPTGAWDAYFNEVLRDLGAPMMPSPPAPANTVCIDRTFWDANMVAPHSTADAWLTPDPTEADLYELTPDLRERSINETSCTLPPARLKVDVVVHHRGLGSVSGANVRVTLLRWIDTRTGAAAAKYNDPGTWVVGPTPPPTGNVPWTAAVNEVLNSADGKTTQAIGAGWQFALGGANQSHRKTLTGSIEPLHPGIVTFDLNLTNFRRNRVVLLVAITRVVAANPADDQPIALAPATLQDLALTSPSVAVRSLRIRP
jgi:hypothetical protein